MNSWTIEQFESAVEEALKEKLEREENNRIVIQKLKMDLVNSCKKFVKDTKEYWNSYCKIISKKVYYGKVSSYERFKLSPTLTLCISRDEYENVCMSFKQNSNTGSNSISLIDINIKGEEVTPKTSSDLNASVLEDLCKSIDENFKNIYLYRLVDALKNE